MAKDTRTQQEKLNEKRGGAAPVSSNAKARQQDAKVIRRKY